MKKWLIYVFITFILAASVSAYSKDKSLEWLKDKTDWSNGQIEDNAFALLALKSNGYNVEEEKDILLQRQDPANCYPKGNCNVKETALAALALKSLNYDINPLLKWLDSSLTKASVTNWYIQIKTDKSGECTIAYDSNQVKKASVNQTQKIKLENKQLNDYWINIEKDLGANLDQPIEQIKVDCTKVNDPNLVISLLRIVGGTDFYIIQESQSSLNNLMINNACYPSFIGGSCDDESSFYAAYVLKRLNQDIKVTPYLIDKADNNLKSSMLYIIGNDQKYLDNLVSNQNNLGYWDNENIYSTSFVVSSLRNTKYKDELNNATGWLRSKQVNEDLLNNGSFGTIRDTGAAIYLALTDSSSSFNSGGTSFLCGNNIKETGETCDDGNNLNGDGCSSICQNELLNQCSKDSDCSIGEKCSEEGVCTKTSCITDSDCPAEETCESQICISKSCKLDIECPINQVCDSFTKKCIEKENNLCNNDGFCDSNEDSLTCLDCESKPQKECGNNICEEGENENSCEIDCKKPQESNSSLLLYILLIIFILGVGGYFGYNKFLKKQPPRKPSYFQEEEPKKQYKEFSQPKQAFSRKNNVDESLEKELDKSIKEAEKLLKK